MDKTGHEKVEAVIAEMERHGSPTVAVYYAEKLRQAADIVGETLTCTCGACKVVK